jgi:phage shock protein PspC (stress-responsive transcriptional regulator)
VQNKKDQNNIIRVDFGRKRGVPGGGRESWGWDQWLFGLVCIVAEIIWLWLFISWLLAWLP